MISTLATGGYNLIANTGSTHANAAKLLSGGREEIVQPPDTVHLQGQSRIGGLLQ